MPHKLINILHLRDSLWVDGPGRTILETASLIDSTKYNYIIGAFVGSGNGSSPLIESATERNLNVFSINEEKSFDLGVVAQIGDFIDSNDIHIVHTHEVRSDLYGLICAKKKKIKLVTTLHGWIENDFKSKVLSRVDRLALHFFDMIIVVSEELKQQIMRYRIPGRKIHVLRNSVFVDKYVIDRFDNAFRDEFNIASKTILVGNIGRLSPEKGQKDFLHAAKMILEKKYDVKFVLIGKGNDQEELERMCVDYHISDSVIFTGYRKDMNCIYNSLDLVVQSSYTEGMPNVILESLLMGTPVIATAVGGTREIIKDGVTGRLIEPGNINVMASEIEGFLKKPSQCSKNTDAAMDYVKGKFDFCWRTKRLSDLYDKLM